MIGWFALNVPSGLSLYYFANTVFTAAQQIYLKKLGGAAARAPVACLGVPEGKRAAGQIMHSRCICSGVVLLPHPGRQACSSSFPRGCRVLLALLGAKLCFAH